MSSDETNKCGIQLSVLMTEEEVHPAFLCIYDLHLKELLPDT